MKKEKISAISWFLGSAIVWAFIAGGLYFFLAVLSLYFVPPEMFNANKVTEYGIYTMVVGAIFGVVIYILKGRQ